MGMVSSQVVISNEKPKFDPNRPAPTFGVFDANGNSINLYGIISGLVNGFGDPIAVNQFLATMVEADDETIVDVRARLEAIEARLDALEA